MSSEYAELLLKRAKMYLESAMVNFTSGRFDVVTVDAEIFTQLALKAKLGFEPPRTQAVRQLIALIVENRPLPSGIEEFEYFTRVNREKLIVLERARAAG